MRGFRRGGLWENRDYLRLWAGQTVSLFGSLVTRIALPFTAVLYLRATPGGMALLAAADLLPGFLIGLFAGAWVDRLRRRPLLIGTDLARAALLASVPLAAIGHALRMEYLFVVALVGGALTTVFDIAYGAYLPSLVPPDDLMEANSRFAASASVASIGSFAIAGWMVQAFSGPHALLIDALTFLFSAGMLLAIQKREPPRPRWHGADDPSDVSDGSALLREVRDGLCVVWRHPLLRPLACCTFLLDFSFAIFGTVIFLFTTRTLGFAPGVQGSIFAIGGVTALSGAMLAGAVTRRFGAGPAMIAGVFFSGIGALFVPLAPSGAKVRAGVCLALNQIVTDPWYMVFDINRSSLRQGAVPDRQRGRVTATFRVFSFGAMLAGTFCAGVCCQKIGIRSTLVVGASGALLASLVLALSPFRGLRVLPQNDWPSET